MIWIVQWYPAKYEDGLLMKGFYTEESAQMYIADQEHPTQYFVQKVSMEAKE